MASLIRWLSPPERVAELRFNERYSSPTSTTFSYFQAYEGLVKYLELQQNEDASAKAQKWSGQFYSRVTCPECNGQRLNKEALHFFIDGKNIAQLADIIGFKHYLFVMFDHDY